MVQSVAPQVQTYGFLSGKHSFYSKKKSFLTIPTKCHFIKFNANAYLIFQAMEDLAGKNTEFSDTNSCV